MTDKQQTENPSPGGFRGERSEGESEGYEHLVMVEDRPVLVAETSGVAFAETRIEAPAPAPVAPAPVTVAATPPEPATPAMDPLRLGLMTAAAVVGGFVLGTLLRRRPRTVVVAETVPVLVPAAFAQPAAPVGSFDQVRDAGPEHIRDGAEQWDAIDENLDESFPASDPPSYSPGVR